MYALCKFVHSCTLGCFVQSCTPVQWERFFVTELKYHVIENQAFIGSEKGSE